MCASSMCFLIVCVACFVAASCSPVFVQEIAVPLGEFLYISVYFNLLDCLFVCTLGFVLPELDGQNIPKCAGILTAKFSYKQ